MAAALAGPALAQAARVGGTDPLSDLLGGGGGNTLLGGQGQNPLMAVTSPLTEITQSKNPLDGITSSVDGTGQSLDGAARVLPQGTFRQGLPLGQAAGTAGIEPRTTGGPLTGAESAPMNFGLLNGREIVGLDHESDPLPGVFGAVATRTDRIVHSPSLEPLTAAAMPQITERLDYDTDYMAFMAQSMSENLTAVSAHDLLSGPHAATSAALPEAVASELAPILGDQQMTEPMRAGVGDEEGEEVPDVPIDGIAPLVDNSLTSTPVVESKGAPAALSNTLHSTDQSAEAVKGLTP
ncbi:hypothetical protein [Nonomuraea typhae]|uniref:hypothetical protein n=1 Tax=Nonomuraea typhae TaxID=2603600 RepID=UPI0012FB429A|nr:hypothetical protein [Nonomuraea typhae]